MRCHTIAPIHFSTNKCDEICLPVLFPAAKCVYARMNNTKGKYQICHCPVSFGPLLEPEGRRSSSSVASKFNNAHSPYCPYCPPTDRASEYKMGVHAYWSSWDEASRPSSSGSSPFPRTRGIPLHRLCFLVPSNPKFYSFCLHVSHGPRRSTFSFVDFSLDL